MEKRPLERFRDRLESISLNTEINLGKMAWCLIEVAPKSVSDSY
jgi:hypothetical protein